MRPIWMVGCASRMWPFWARRLCQAPPATVIAAGKGGAMWLPAGARCSALLMSSPRTRRSLSSHEGQRAEGIPSSPTPVALDHDTRIGAPEGTMIVAEHLAHTFLRAEETGHLAGILLNRLDLGGQRAGDLDQFRLHRDAERGLACLERPRLSDIGKVFIELDVKLTLCQPVG